MERLKLHAISREVGRKSHLSRLREEGKIPAILYGQSLDPLPLAVGGKELVQHIKTKGLNVLMELDLEGKKSAKPLVVMVKDFQTDVLSHAIIHLDLLTVDLTEKVTVSIPIRVFGKPVGVTNGGLIEQSRRELEVQCLPDRIPNEIEVDITALDIGDSIHVNELKLPEGVAAPHEANFTIVAVIAPRAEEPSPEAAAAAPVEGAAAAPAEGAAAAPAEGAAAAPAKGTAAPAKKPEEKK